METTTPFTPYPQTENGKFQVFGKLEKFPLIIEGDWVRIHCGVDGYPNYIFGIEGLKQFYEAGAGIYFRDKDGKPKDSFEWWEKWYKEEKEERIQIYNTINDLRKLLKKLHL